MGYKGFGAVPIGNLATVRLLAAILRDALLMASLVLTCFLRLAAMMYVC